MIRSCFPLGGFAQSAVALVAVLALFGCTSRADFPVIVRGEGRATTSSIDAAQRMLPSALALIEQDDPGLKDAQYQLGDVIDLYEESDVVGVDASEVVLRSPRLHLVPILIDGKARYEFLYRVGQQGPRLVKVSTSGAGEFRALMEARSLIGAPDRQRQEMFIFEGWTYQIVASRGRFHELVFTARPPRPAWLTNPLLAFEMSRIKPFAVYRDGPASSYLVGSLELLHP